MAERYTYMFDNKGRILMVALSDNLSAPGTYSRGYTYDLHGNILSVATPTDTTAVSYTGNQRSGNFTYDANGNMTADPEAGLTGMTYNVLNLLSGYNAANNRQFLFKYSASGEKLSEQEKVSGLIENEKKYFGNLVYENSLIYPTRLLIDGGYVDISTSNNSSSYTYRYYVQDHLGNNRLVTDDSGTILQTNHYDPYGQLLGNISSSTPVSQYKYANKEWDTTTASYDFGARRYTPAVPRWTTIDPLAEKYYAISPYVYCAGNPVNRIDPDGKWDVTVHLYSNRAEYGRGVAIVTNKSGEEVYRFEVRAQGVKGDNRSRIGADTPLGVYTIPKNKPWIHGGSRASYGPNPRLNMEGESGEIVDTGRSHIRIHGGRQEVLDGNDWKPVKTPELKKTYGCLRAYDVDMAAFKSTVDAIAESDPSDTPGRVVVLDDLVKYYLPCSEDNMVEVVPVYEEPQKKKQISRFIEL